MIFALTISDLGYAGLHSAWFLDPAGREHSWQAITPGRGWTCLSCPAQRRWPSTPARCRCGSTHRSKAYGCAPWPRASRPISRLTGRPGRTSWASWCPGRRTSSSTPSSRPRCRARHRHPRSTTYIFDDAWATWDFGRGRWPRTVVWNWGSGAGVSDGRRIGLQLGGKWTDGTPMTENAIFVDGRCHKLGEVLDWSYEPGAWLSPWKVRNLGRLGQPDPAAKARPPGLGEPGGGEQRHPPMLRDLARQRRGRGNGEGRRGRPAWLGGGGHQPLVVAFRPPDPSPSSTGSHQQPSRKRARGLQWQHPYP